MKEPDFTCTDVDDCVLFPSPIPLEEIEGDLATMEYQGKKGTPVYKRVKMAASSARVVSDAIKKSIEKSKV